MYFQHSFWCNEPHSVLLQICSFAPWHTCSLWFEGGTSFAYAVMTKFHFVLFLFCKYVLISFKILSKTCKRNATKWLFTWLSMIGNRLQPGINFAASSVHWWIIGLFFVITSTVSFLRIKLASASLHNVSSIVPIVS